MYNVPSALAPMTSLLGRIYGILIRTRNRAYSAGLLSQHRLPGPVISLGGSGKTPLTIHIAQTLLELGFHSAILSRGYGRKYSRRSWILSPGETVPNPDSALGDEPALMRRYLPCIWMGISANRFRAGSAIAKAQPATTFILDDGFQHRGLYRNLDIVIIDPWQPLQFNRIFPAGTLREPVSELRRCHLAVINGRADTEATALVAASLQNFIGETAIFFCTQRIHALIPFSSWQNAEKHCAGSEWPHSAYLVTAVGNPARFQRDIQQLGIEVRGVHFFRDHYRLEQKDWDACINEARIKSVDAIITTEKDAIKILRSPDFPLYVAIQTLELSDENNFRQVLVNSIKNYSPES
jgi:tetraacyldisaccharide 4'-kinase